ncbi:hypothetical protein AK830_g9983 [Neonectria ditissima]|uniref:Receptor L-domain domain-containing protein n=1 Tax=Neonectria ditissima TaxID=78410 RepID=A0A0P7B857_9HYPO|nr:hypothetical protein AK830_g9983 [Neonectria ditissima]
MLIEILGVARAVTCQNVTISNATEAASIRRGCKIITGNLVFEKVQEDINLDGVEEIIGHVYHEDSDCDPYSTKAQPCVPPPSNFSISSSTLVKVGGYFKFREFAGLTELRLPNLTTVYESMDLQRQHYLQRLDMTKLSAVGDFSLDAMSLKSLKHESLKSFTQESGQVSLKTSIESVDSFFTYPIPANETGTDREGHFSVQLTVPNVKHFTLGWPKVNNVNLQTESNLNITFGTANTTSVKIKEVLLSSDIAFRRHEAVKNLTIKRLSLKGSTTKHFNVSVDHLSSLLVMENYDLASIELPPKAVDWKNFDLYVVGCSHLNLTSEYRVTDDGHKERIWYWPQYNMSSVSISGTPISNDFFETFLQAPKGADSSDVPKVREYFALSPLSTRYGNKAELNCTPFEELRKRGVLPEDYFCEDVTLQEESVASLTAVHESVLLALGFLATALFCI